jgi:NADH-quinone oxidoreductase subunit C
VKIDQLLEASQAKWPGSNFEIDILNSQCLVIPVALVPDYFVWLQQDESLSLDYYEFCTCVDHPPELIDVVYSLYSTSLRHRFQFKVKLDRFNPHLSTLSHLWANADWNEREVYDLFGVFFENHKDLRRLMMPEDWEGHPLRKDYMHPNLVARPD